MTIFACSYFDTATRWKKYVGGWGILRICICHYLIFTQAKLDMNWRLYFSTFGALSKCKDDWRNYSHSTRWFYHINLRHNNITKLLVGRKNTKDIDNGTKWCKINVHHGDFGDHRDVINKNKIQGLSHRHPTHSLMIFDVCFGPVYCSCTVARIVVKVKLKVKKLWTFFLCVLPIIFLQKFL